AGHGALDEEDVRLLAGLEDAELGVDGRVGRDDPLGARLGPALALLDGGPRGPPLTLAERGVEHTGRRAGVVRVVAAPQAARRGSAGVSRERRREVRVGVQRVVLGHGWAPSGGERTTLPPPRGRRRARTVADGRRPAQRRSGLPGVVDTRAWLVQLMAFLPSSGARRRGRRPETVPPGDRGTAGRARARVGSFGRGAHDAAAASRAAAGADRRGRSSTGSAAVGAPGGGGHASVARPAHGVPPFLRCPTARATS